MRSPWKLLAALEALALLAVFVLWPRGAEDSASSAEPVQEMREVDAAGAVGNAGTTPSTDTNEGVVSRADMAPAAAPARPTAGTDPLGVVLAGHVSDERGEPVERAGLYLSHPDGTKLRAVTDAEGNYTFAGLRPATYGVDWISLGYVTAKSELTVTPTPAFQRRDFTLPRANEYLVRLETSTGLELLEWMADNGFGESYLRRCVALVAAPEPVEHFPPEALYAPRNSYAYFQQRGIAPNQVVPDGFTGLLTLAAPLPLYATAVFRDIPLGAVRLEAGATEIVLQVDESRIGRAFGSIQARILDAVTGMPVPAARLYVNPGFDGTSWRADDEGRARATPVLPGTTRITVRAAGYPLYTTEIQLAPGADVDLGDLRLRAGAQVTVRAFLPDGSPAAGASGSYWDPELTGAPGREDLREFTLDDAGQVVLESVPVGRVEFALNGADGAARMVRSVTVPPEGTQVDLRLPAGVEVRIDFGTEWFDPYRYTLREARGESYGPRLAAGVNTLQLPPGAYRIEVTRADGAAVTERGITVAGEPLDVRIELP